MSYNNFEVCRCPCHDPKRKVRHVMACCFKCPHCGLNIKRGYHQLHMEECEKKQKEMHDMVEALYKDDN